MASYIGLGFSQNADLPAAIFEVSTQIRRQLRSHKPDFLLVFNTPHYQPNELIGLLRENFTGAKLCGCSAHGILSSSAISLRGVAVLAVASDDTFFATSSVSNFSTRDIHQAGTVMGKRAIHQFGAHQRKAFVYFGDDLSEINNTLVDSFHGAFGSFFSLLGASISDYYQTKKLPQYCDDTTFSNGITGFLLGGRMNLGIGSRHGWKPLGRPRAIDSAKGNIIYLIDGQAAVKIYDDYFGDEALNLRMTARSQMSILYPLGIYRENEKEYLLRNVLAVQSSGSLLCQGEVPQGTEAHIMISNKDSCVQAATDAALEAQKQLGDRPATAIIVINSFSRLKFLGRSASREIQAIKDVFGEETPIIGMYGYGEVAPAKTFTEKNLIDLQNSSIMVIAIG